MKTEKSSKISCWLYERLNHNKTFPYFYIFNFEFNGVLVIVYLASDWLVQLTSSLDRPPSSTRLIVSKCL